MEEEKIMKTKTKEIPLIDILKFFFALCIVALHTGICDIFPESVGWYIEHCIFRLAVPYYFVATGYFLGKKLNKCNSTDEAKLCVKNYSKRLMYPLLLWGTFGLIKNAAENIYNGKSIAYILLDVGRHIVFYPLNAMWFCLACIVAAWLIYYFVVRRKNIKIAVLLSGGGVLPFTFI